MIRRLKLKFVVINMTMVTIMLCVIFVLVYHFTRAGLESESIRMMQTIAADPMRLGQPGDGAGDLHLPYFTLQLGLKGELVATGGGYFDLSDEALLRELIAQSLATHREIGVIDEHALRYCRVSTPVGTVLVFADMSSENSTLRNLLQSCVLIGAFAFAVFLLISLCLARWAVRPVARAWAQQKQFVADASHELKTPLTVILTNAELLESGTLCEDERRSFTQSIVLMSRQMRRLLEKLLEAARAEEEHVALPRTRVALSQLALDTAIAFEGVFAEKGLTLQSTAEPDLFVRGSEAALRQVIEILLDNAQKYAFPGTCAALELSRSGPGRCRLRVINRGPEIPEREQEKIFQRFYRVDRVRARDGSFGLGLSIAQNIVTRHKGRIWAESRDGVNTFTVELRTD